MEVIGSIRELRQRLQREPTVACVPTMGNIHEGHLRLVKIAQQHAPFVVTTIFFTKMVVDWFAGRELATAMAVLVMSWPFGIALGQVGHGWLAEMQGWRAPFVAASLYCPRVGTRRSRLLPSAATGRRLIG